MYEYKFEPLPKLTRKEVIWEEAQALKVLAFADLRYTDREAFFKAVEYEPYPRLENPENKDAVE